MRAAVTVEPGRIELRELPEPEPGPDEALVRPRTVGICGSDLHIWSGHHPYAVLPLVQGHELSAVVERAPAGGRLRAGDVVAVEPFRPCGACAACRRGRGNCCPRLRTLGVHLQGGLADLLAVPASSLHPTGDLEPELGALVEPVSIAVQAVARARVEAGEQVLVFGAGPIGLGILLAARDRGARAMLVDRLHSRLELARRLGADVASPTAAPVRDWTGGEGPAAVFDAVGAAAVTAQAVDLVASAGRVVVVGICDEPVTLPMLAFTLRELDLLGSKNNSGRFGEAVELVRRRREEARLLISHRFSLAQVEDAFRLAGDHPERVAKVLIDVVDPP